METFDLADTLSNDNWLLSGRLLKEGSKKSLKKLEEMEEEEMVTLDGLEAIWAKEGEEQ